VFGLEQAAACRISCLCPVYGGGGGQEPALAFFKLNSNMGRGGGINSLSLQRRMGSLTSQHLWQHPLLRVGAKPHSQEKREEEKLDILYTIFVNEGVTGQYAYVGHWAAQYCTYLVCQKARQKGANKQTCIQCVNEFLTQLWLLNFQ
jgi:hypothetical protein